MTEQEAIKIIKLLKSGKSYKKGHYHYGYIYYEHEPYDNTILYTKEDLSINVYEPDIAKQKYNEDEFIKILIEQYDFDDFKNHLI